MYSISTFIKVLCFLLAVSLLQGCREEGIIGEKDMALLISEMYLVDQFLEVNPSLKLQADSMLVYPVIMEKHGFTVEMYEKSMNYYMQEGESYNNILKDAKDLLTARQKTLKRLIKETQDKQAMSELHVWWAIDSARSVKPEEFLYDKLLRGVRWMVLRDELKQTWRMSDSAIVDIPQNPQWWKNVLSTPDREYKSIIVRSVDSKIDKEDLRNEKDRRKLSLSGRRRLTDKERVPASERLR